MNKCFTSSNRSLFLFNSKVVLVSIRKKKEKGKNKTPHFIYGDKKRK